MKRSLECKIYLIKKSALRFLHVHRINYNTMFCTNFNLLSEVSKLMRVVVHAGRHLESYYWFPGSFVLGLQLRAQIISAFK